MIIKKNPTLTFAISSEISPKKYHVFFPLFPDNQKKRYVLGSKLVVLVDGHPTLNKESFFYGSIKPYKNWVDVPIPYVTGKPQWELIFGAKALVCRIG